MPDKVIDIPGYGQVAFPDTMSDADVNAAAAKLYREKNPNHPPPDPTHSWIDTAVDWLPTAAGAAGGLIGSVGGPLTAIGGAALGGAAGEAVRGSIEEMRGTRTPQSLTKNVTDVAGQAALQGGAEVIGAGVGAAMKPIGAALMQSAVKPGLKATARALFKGVSTEDLPIVKTLLKEKVNVSSAGIAKLDRIINASNQEIKDAVASIPGDINPYKVTARLGDTARKFEAQVNPEASMRQIQEAGEEFLRSHGDQMLAPGRAQDLKTGTYRQLKDTVYGQLSGAQIEAQKDLARGLKEEIQLEYAKSLPGLKASLGLPGGVDIAAANAKEGAAISAKEAIAKRLAAAGNRDPASLAWLAHNPVAGLAFVLERSPAAKSLLARGLYNQAGLVTKVSPNVLRTMVHAVASSDDQESQ